MGFVLGTWKAKVSEQLQGWQPRMNQVGANSVYGFLSAATLWPVVEAAHGGEWAALAALGGVVGGVGSNLLAARMEKWKSEADAAQHIATDIVAEPKLRAELDAVLEKLDVFAQAQQVLAEADRQWFIKTLRAELTQQGNLTRFEARLIGSGAVAQGNRSTAAGGRGVAVQGHITDNTIITGNITQNLYAGGTGGPPSDLPPYMEIITPGSHFGRLDSEKGRFALLLRVKFRNESEQPVLIQHFRIQHLGVWHEPRIHTGSIGLRVADGILAAGLRLEENIGTSPRISAMDVSERTAFFLLPDPSELFPGPNELQLIAEAAFTRRSPRQIAFTLTDQGKINWYRENTAN